MVRNIVGTFIQIEMGLRAEDSIAALLNSKERMRAGPSVQPQGLYLTRVYYPAELDNLA
jgi:tRNA pseudouridine38-40 synthase